MTMKKVRLRERKVASRRCARLFSKKINRVERAVSSTWTLRENRSGRELLIEKQCLKLEVASLSISTDKAASRVIAQKLRRIEKITQQMTTDHQNDVRSN